jgi:hypothetical protein
MYVVPARLRNLHWYTWFASCMAVCAVCAGPAVAIDSCSTM